MTKATILVMMAAAAMLLASQTIEIQEPKPPSEKTAADEADSPQETDSLKATFISTYYEGQSSRAFKMLQKSIFKSLLDDWTAKSVENPLWDYESFTRYSILDEEMHTKEAGEEMYSCTFTADNNKYGYVVVAYSGDGLTRIYAGETAYPYDLRANIDDIKAALKDADIDTATAAATRVRVMNADGTSAEAIRITDSQGHDYMCYLDETALRIET